MAVPVEPAELPMQIIQIAVVTLQQAAQAVMAVAEPEPE